MTLMGTVITFFTRFGGILEILYLIARTIGLGLTCNATNGKWRSVDVSLGLGLYAAPPCGDGRTDGREGMALTSSTLMHWTGSTHPKPISRQLELPKR
jgi:hypothetical protein